MAGDYVWLTYNEVWERVQDFASGLLKLDLVPERYGVGIICPSDVASMPRYFFSKSFGVVYCGAGLQCLQTHPGSHI